MPTASENLKTRRDNICAQLAAITTSTAGGLPNATGDGGGVDHDGHVDRLYRELKQINEMIAAVSPAFEVTSEARG